MIKTQTCRYESAIIDSTSYDFKNLELYVAFKTGGSYLYKNVTNEIYHEFVNSESHGKAFSSLIKNNSEIEFEKLEETISEGSFRAAGKL